MKYPIAIEPGTHTTAWGVVVPDLPGCFSAGDTMDDAYAMAKEAVEAWINSALDNDATIPPAAPLESHMANPEFAGWAWAVIDIDVSDFEDTIERINITIPRRVLRQIDRYVERQHDNRSSFLAASALKAIQHEVNIQ